MRRAIWSKFLSLHFGDLPKDCRSEILRGKRKYLPLQYIIPGPGVNHNTIRNGMKTYVTRLMMLALMALSLNANAADFFSTEPADNFFNLGVRVGVNTSSASVSSKQLVSGHSSWGTGFDAGVVADININNWLTLQPGFFYQSRSGDYYTLRILDNSPVVTDGHTLYYMFNVPLMVSARFNISDDLRWSVDAGPYLSFGLGHNDVQKVVIANEILKYKPGYFDTRNKFQWGFKFGTGLQFRRHYYVGVHYMAGCRNVYNASAHDALGYSGRHKSWIFTLGYDF